jgi:hypothetical protein
MALIYFCMACALPSEVAPGTKRAKKWIPIVPCVASVIDETDDSVIIRYARDKAGRA